MALPAPADILAGLVAAMNTAADALTRHQAQANKVRTKATRTTVTGPGGTKSALPSKDAIHALVATLPGTADSDYTEVKDAEEARGDMVKAIGTFTKEAVNTSAGIIYTALVDRTFEPLSNLHEKTSKDITAITDALAELQSNIDKLTGAMGNVKRAAHVQKFNEDLAAVRDEYAQINKLNDSIKELDAETRAITSQDAGDEVDYDELKRIQKKREMLDKESARVVTAIVQRLLPQISATTGTSRDERYDRRKPITIPSSLEGKGAELQDNMMTYALSKGKDMSTLIPAIIRMVYDYDPVTSLWWSWKDYSDSTDDYDSVPESMRPLMREHNNQLYLDIKAAMQKTTANKALWTRINATHSLGRDNKHCNAEEGDGLGLFWMMIMLYRPSDEKYREKLEQDTYALCKRLSTQSKSNPKKFIEEVRIKLEDCDALGVHLKWMLTGKALVTSMSTRSNVLAQKLQQYTKGDHVIDRDNCSVEMGSICALVEEGLAELEDASGGADRAMFTNKDSKDQTPCNRGDKCYAMKCPYAHMHAPTFT